MWNEAIDYVEDALNPPCTLKLEREYTLTDVVGRGGSSIVYKGYYLNGTHRVYEVIKELFPTNMGITRNKDGALIIPDKTMEDIDSFEKMAFREYNVASELRMANDGKDNDSRFLLYGKPIKSDRTNTWYTVIGTEFGVTLKSLIENKYFKTFSDICKCLLSIMDDALGPIHSKGYLHLDVAPDNIRFTLNDGDKVEIGNARLIDYNSAYKMDGTIEVGRKFSSKKGYSAPELEKLWRNPGVLEELRRNPGTKSFPLSFATDTYSICAIFFALLKGRNHGTEDRRKSRFTQSYQWELTDEDTFMKGMSSLLIRKVNTLLKKGLGLSTEDKRYKTVPELRVAIAELQELSEGMQLVNTPKFNPGFGYFVPGSRQKELEMIDTILEKRGYIFLEGVGGIGKTELSKQYAEEYRNKYDIVQLVYFDGNLKSTIATRLAFRNFDYRHYEKTYGKNAMENAFNDKVDSLLRLHDKNTLIIVDNYDVIEDRMFRKFTEGNYRVIFTSRKIHEGDKIEKLYSLNITEMRGEDGSMNIEHLKELFYFYTHCDIEEEDSIRKIIELLEGHTMAVQLAAQTIHKSGKTAAELYERLQEGFDPKLRARVKLEKEDIDIENKERVMYEHIRNLFDIAEIRNNENHLYIMTNMTIVPYSGLEKKLFYKWALYERYRDDNYDDEDYNDIDDLINNGWIRIDDETERLSLHPVISDVLNSELKPDSKKCYNLIECFSSDTDCLRTYVDWDFALTRNQLAVKRITDSSWSSARLLNCVGILHNKLSDYSKAIDLFKQASGIYQICHGNAENINFIKDWAFGYISRHSNDVDDFTVLHKLYIEIINMSKIETSFLHVNLGNTLFSAHQWKEGLYEFEIALKMHSSLYGENSEEIAALYNQIGACLTQESIYLYKRSSDDNYLKDYSYADFDYDDDYFDINIMERSESEKLSSLALDYFMKSLTILKDCPSEALAILYLNLGRYYVNVTKNYETALDYYQRCYDKCCDFIDESQYFGIVADVALCRSHIAYGNYKEITESLKLMDEAIKNQKVIYGECHIEIAHSMHKKIQILKQVEMLSNHDDILACYEIIYSIYLLYYGKEHALTARVKRETSEYSSLHNYCLDDIEGWKLIISDEEHKYNSIKSGLLKDSTSVPLLSSKILIASYYGSLASNLRIYREYKSALDNYQKAVTLLDETKSFNLIISPSSVKLMSKYKEMIIEIESLFEQNVRKNAETFVSDWRRGSYNQDIKYLIMMCAINSRAIISTKADAELPHDDLRKLPQKDGSDTIPVEIEVVELFDDNGNSMSFEVLGNVTLNNVEYVLITHLDEEETTGKNNAIPADVFVLREITVPDGSKLLEPLDDINLMEHIFKLFKDTNKEKYTFD